MEDTFFKLNNDVLKLLFKRLDPKSIVNLCNSSSIFRDYCNQKDFFAYNTGDYEKMDADSLSSIMKFLKPEDVVMFCVTNYGFRKLCNQGNFWNNVLNYHYNITNVSNVEAKKLYLEKTMMTIVAPFEVFGQRKLVNMYGVKFDIMEDFEKMGNESFLINSRGEENWEDEDTIKFTIPASMITQKEISVSVNYSYDSDKLIVKYHKNISEAVREFVDSFKRDDFIEMFDMSDRSGKKYSESNFVEKIYDNEDDIPKHLISYFYIGTNMETGKITATFFSQSVLNKIVKMGYPSFRANETLDQSKERLYDYIIKHKFLYRDMDFSEVPQEDYRRFQVVNLKLNLFKPDWW
tara:strand:+ start:1087 stop:2133 length:1047 start_codon:yes stop_codon:yes gene_type:complete